MVNSSKKNLNTIIFSPFDVHYHFTGDSHKFVSLDFYSQSEISIPSNSPIIPVLRAIALYLKNRTPLFDSDTLIDEEVEKALIFMFADPGVNVSIRQSRRMVFLDPKPGRQTSVVINGDTIGTLYCVVEYDGKEWNLLRIEI